MYLLSTGSVPGMGSITVLHPVLKPSPQPLFLAIFSGTWISRPLFQFSSICLTVFLCRTFHTCSLGILGNFPGDFSKSIMVQEKWSRNGHFLPILPDLVSLSPVTPPALLSTTERWGSGITFSWQLHPSYSFPCSMGEFIGIGWDQFWPSRLRLVSPASPGGLAVNTFAEVLLISWSEEGGNPATDLQKLITGRCWNVASQHILGRIVWTFPFWQ